jgi:hypothetical protein
MHSGRRDGDSIRCLFRPPRESHRGSVLGDEGLPTSGQVEGAPGDTVRVVGRDRLHGLDIVLGRRPSLDRDGPRPSHRQTEDGILLELGVRHLTVRLEECERARRRVAKRVVALTDRMTRVAKLRSRRARLLRNLVLDLLGRNPRGAAPDRDRSGRVTQPAWEAPWSPRRVARLRWRGAHRGPAITFQVLGSAAVGRWNHEAHRTV